MTFQDAAEMGLAEMDCYRLLRAFGELRLLVDEIWRRPNQLSTSLKQDSLEHHRLKLSQTNIESAVQSTVQAPVTPQGQLVLPITKRVRFNDEVDHVAY